jgi:signal transduction histidine kinase
MDKRILLVDDEAGIRNVLGLALADAGYEMHTAENGEEALEVFRRVQPAIVLTDIKMPGMDGIELLRRVKAESPDTEVIMLTGHGDIDLAIKSLKFQATDFITKPIHDEALEIALGRARERIQMRRQLREYTENLEMLVAEKSRRLVAAERLAAVGETVAGLSHAIKNIAGALEGGVFVLEKGIELEKRKYLLQGWEMVKGNVEKITRLSLDLLDFGKSTGDNILLSDPNAPAREVAALIQSRSAEHNIELSLDLDEDLVPIHFDPEAIHRCLMNLVVNALDACLAADMGAREPNIRISTTKADGWGVAYEVADTGCGILPEVREKIFQTFFTTKGAGGTGIGLMLTRKIIDKHRGRINVSSDPDKGTVVSILLPVDPRTDCDGMN